MNGTTLDWSTATPDECDGAAMLVLKELRDRAVYGTSEHEALVHAYVALKSRIEDRAAKVAGSLA